MFESLRQSGWPWDYLLAPLLALLGQPVLLGELALLAGILLFAVGRQLGAPLQFFHEKPLVQVIAGFSATLTAAHIFFVIYLAEAGPDDALRKPLAVWFVLLWVSVVALAAILREVARRKPAKVPEPLKLSPSLRDTSAEVSPLPFVGGVALALALLMGSVTVLNPLLAGLDQLAAPTMDSLGRPDPVHPGLHLVALLLTVALLIVLLGLRSRATPALAFCALLSIVATAIGASNYWFGASTIVTLIGLLLAAWVGRELYAIRIPDLQALYGPKGRPYPPPVRRPGAATLPDNPLLADVLITKDAQPPALPSSSSRSGKRPLVLVCTSGGGVRAAAWTAGLLGRLSESVPEFPALTLMITGASGGMVGAAYWLADRARSLETSQPCLPWEVLTKLVSRESLTTITRTLVLNDLPKSFFSRVNVSDRGARMQDTWQAVASEAQLNLNVPLSTFRNGERARQWPSLVFSPMVVEDGRRLLLSNLRLAAVAESESFWVEDVDRPDKPPRQTVPVRPPASHNAFHAADIFGKAADQITLATAARLSAAFPYISPAVVLPTEPRTRVVDAGYYDNYGIDLATGWLREALEHHADWLEANISGILLVQIRDDISPLSEGRDGVPKPLPAVRKGFFAALARGLEGLTTPLQGFLAARASVMQLRNDSQLDAICRAYQARFGKEFMAHELFELKGKLSISWYLAESEVAEVLAQLHAVGYKVDKVANWLRP